MNKNKLDLKDLLAFVGALALGYAIFRSAYPHGLTAVLFYISFLLLAASGTFAIVVGAIISHLAAGIRALKAE